MDQLAKVFSLQEQLVDFKGPYKNELATIKLLHEPTKKQHFQQLTKQLLAHLEKEEQNQRHDHQSCQEEARLLREEGNRIYKAMSNQNRLLEACRLYTKAIFKAESAYDELCLAFANRGMALQEFGYYQEAYDDCCHALEFGYNQKLQHKIVIRLAYCAAKLKNIEDLERHLECLREKDLNDGYIKQLLELEEILTDLQESKDTANKQTQKEEHLDKQEIIIDSNCDNRYMIAKNNIAAHEVIFQEMASAFVPIEDNIICHQCATSFMCAPIPCPHCHHRVIYCSRACRQSHLYIHQYECAAYRLNLLQMLGVSHLAMRLVLTYLPEILTHFTQDSNTLETWTKLLELNQKGHSKVDPLRPQYATSLGMISHLNKVSPNELMYYALSANLLQVYLEKHTKFFEQFPLNKRQDSKIIVSALILRHAGQLLVNGHVGYALSFSLDLPLLEPSIWQSTWRLKLGCLHKLSQIKLTTAMNLPYLSLCNHACDPSIRTKFDGRQIIVYASKNIKAGDEIFNCYTQDYNNSLRQERTEHLQDVYKFQCRCTKCMKSDYDEAYLNYHQYKCESCGKWFAPTNLNWWLESDLEVAIDCTHCKVQQVFPWYQQFFQLLENIHDKSSRQLLYKSFYQLNNCLLDHNSLKLNMAGELIEACFKAREDGYSLDTEDYLNLEKVIRQQLLAVSVQKGSHSLNYLGKMTYLWDLMALKKCKLDKEELETMLKLLENLAREIRDIFINYYNDFIEQQQQCK
ncbi:SET and MYND domain-containing protein 4 [Drosophila willistoni]|uniref:GK21490 n=1 Tax=Drosophila willistoni TaxID=7260 RepID=B4MQ48_DROWI|nr:SET and MYND domain-containing protein 4 [Drosophila willistoni]